MSVRLVPIDQKNWRAFVKLEVAPEQVHYVAANVYSIAQSKVEPYWETVGILAGEDPVGFAMYGRVPEDGRYWICRLMVDRAHQGKGYGRAAMELILGDLGSRPDCSHVWISFVPDNTAAKDLYASLGFDDLDLVEDGETVFRLTIARAPAGLREA